MKWILKNKEKSLGSEEIEARAYEDNKSRIFQKQEKELGWEWLLGLGLMTDWPTDWLTNQSIKFICLQ